MGSAPYPNQVAPPQFGVCHIAQPRDTAPARGLSHTLIKGHPPSVGVSHSPTRGHPPSAGSSLVGLHQGSPCRWPCHRRRSSPRAPHYLSCPRRRAARPGRGCPPRCSSGPRRDPPHPRGTMRAAGTWWLGLGLGLGAALAALSPLGSARLGATPAANPSPARPLPAEVRSCGAGAGTGARPPHPRKPPAPPRPFLPTPCARGAARGLRARGRAPGRPLWGPGGERGAEPRDPRASALPGLRTQWVGTPSPPPQSCGTRGTRSLGAQDPRVCKPRVLRTPALHPGAAAPMGPCKHKALGAPRFTS